MKEHETTRECWCRPNVNDGVVSHRTELEYAIYELTLIGDICVDYDGCRTAESLMELVDEVRDRAYKTVALLKEPE